MLKLTAQVAGTLCACLFLFIQLGQHKSTEAARNWPFFVAFVYLLIVAARAANIYSYRKLLMPSLASSILFVVFYQFIGNLWFPGIVKDLVFLSVSNITFCFFVAFSLAVAIFLYLGSIKIVLKHFGLMGE